MHDPRGITCSADCHGVFGVYGFALGLESGDKSTVILRGKKMKDNEQKSAIIARRDESAELN